MAENSSIPFHEAIERFGTVFICHREPYAQWPVKGLFDQHTREIYLAITADVQASDVLGATSEYWFVHSVRAVMAMGTPVVRVATVSAIQKPWATQQDGIG
jgi:hypothetical protein